MSKQELASKIVGWLFQTGAIRVSPADRPFWYTSGLIGPYYVNTHFLYGSEQKANQLLSQMDQGKDDPLACTKLVRAALWENYHADAVFRQVTDALVQYIKENFVWQNMDSISGGERRDWFFSMLPAEILGKPHLNIFKDQQVVQITAAAAALVDDLRGQRVLHISDLITEASSYLRAWIPALANRGAIMADTLTIVDRQQGGGEALRQAGIAMQSLVQINRALFQEAKAQGFLSGEQFQLVEGYLSDPFHSMRDFLLQTPEFLQNALSADPKTRERAERLLAQDLYQLK